MRAWAHHFALNVGQAVSSMWWAFVPPQRGHTPAQLKELESETFLYWLCFGFGFTEKGRKTNETC